jgi:hypothetical protein
MTDTAVDAPFYSPEFGTFLPGKARRLAEVLHDYNPYLSLVFIPPAARNEFDTHPYGILDSSPWKGEQIIRHIAERELDDPNKILQWLFEGDLSKHGVSELMAREQAKKFADDLLREKRNAEIAEERQELAAALVSGGRDKKHAYRHNGKIFTDQGARDAASSVY